MEPAVVFCPDSAIDVRPNIQIRGFLIFALQLDGNADARAQARGIIASHLFITDHRERVRHAGHFLFAIVFGKDNLHFDGGKDLHSIFGFRFVLAVELQHRQAECSYQEQAFPFLHGIPPGGFEPFLDLKTLRGAHCDFSSARSLTSSLAIWICATCRGARIVASESWVKSGACLRWRHCSAYSASRTSSSLGTNTSEPERRVIPPFGEFSATKVRCSE